jgi:hypothetical protein
MMKLLLKGSENSNSTADIFDRIHFPPFVFKMVNWIIKICRNCIADSISPTNKP